MLRCWNEFTRWGDSCSFLWATRSSNFTVCERVFRAKCILRLRGLYPNTLKTIDLTGATDGLDAVALSHNLSALFSSKIFVNIAYLAMPGATCVTTGTRSHCKNCRMDSSLRKKRRGDVSLKSGFDMFLLEVHSITMHDMHKVTYLEGSSVV